MPEPTDAPASDEQHADETRRETHRATRYEPEDGPSPQDLALDLVQGSVGRLAGPDGPLRILEVGCGAGALAERLMGLEGAEVEVVAVDASEQMVELAAERGVQARQADLGDLPFEDEELDVVVALWVIHQLPEPREALREMRRVLRPDGLLVVVADGDRHAGELLDLAGAQGQSESEGPDTGEAQASPTQRFSTQNGDLQLRTFFDEVESTTIPTRAVFADHAAAREYLASIDPQLAERLPEFEGEKAVPGETTVFAATAGRPL